MHDSKNPDSGALAFTPPEWRAFVSSIKSDRQAARLPGRRHPGRLDHAPALSQGLSDLASVHEATPWSRRRTDVLYAMLRDAKLYQPPLPP